jgi:hypothetical protein
MKAAGIKPDPSAMKGMRKLFGAQFIYSIITTRVLFMILKLSPNQDLGSLLTLMFAVRVGLPLMG